MFDITLRQLGALVLFIPETTAARAWLSSTAKSDGLARHGSSACVEKRKVKMYTDQANAAGLVVSL